MMMHHMAGVADYDWSKWPSTAFPLTEELKTKAADIADKFTTAAEVQKYFETSSDPIQLKVVVQYAATARKQAIADVETVVGSPLTPESKGTGIYSYSFGLKKDETPQPKKEETPVLLYALGAAALFLLLRK